MNKLFSVNKIETAKLLILKEKDELRVKLIKLCIGKDDCKKAANLIK